MLPRISPRRVRNQAIDPASDPALSEVTPAVFISYSRRDKAFVQNLHAALSRLNQKSWVDWQGILPTEKWWKAIEAGIESAHTFVFVISPTSIASAVCTQEIEHAIQHNKRLVPILYQEVDAALVHPAMSSHNWVLMRDSDDFETAVQRLVTAIETNLPYVRNHTRLLMKAIEWQRSQRDPSFLLRGSDLNQSEEWLKQGRTQSPRPTDLQVEYITTSRQSPHLQPTPRTVVLTSAIVTILLMGIRFLGILEPLELKAYDQFMQLRPTEPPDSRLLVIEMTDDDIQAQLQRDESGKGTLSDRSLARLLETLERYQPRLIGLDIYRDFKADPVSLAKQLRSDRLIALCKVPETDTQQSVINSGVAPPPEVSSQRVGFGDVVLDQDNGVRRHLLTQQAVPNASCASTQAFSLVLARRYLEFQSGGKIAYRDPLISEENLQLGQVVFPRLGAFSNGYQAIDASGYQTLLNYRATSDGARNLAQRVTVEDVLKGKLSEKEVRDRIVLIGVTATSGVNDYHTTPYQTLPGVTVQAQMVSQILSAVLDGRSLLTVWAPWGDALWILVWGLVGGTIVYFIHKPIRLVLAGGGAIVILLVSCWGFLVMGSVWVPLIPSVLSLVLTGAGAMYVTIRQYQVKKYRPMPA
ncbi:CHASE2 domain-containing protein [Phormidesmis sp. 146-33]